MAKAIDFLNLSPQKKKLYQNKAASLRLLTANKYRDIFLNSYEDKGSREKISNSFLNQYIDLFPNSNSVKVISFNLFINEKCIEEILKMSDPLEIAYVSSIIGELTYRSFIDPNNILKTLDFLAPSKELGYFFTPPEIAFLMADKIFSTSETNIDILDPSAGYGSLLVAALVVAKKKGVTIKSVTAIEIDPFTANNLEKILERVMQLLEIKATINVLNTDAIEYLSEGMGRLFGRTSRYNKIIMNPPYGRVKFLKSFLTNKETRTSDIKFSLDEQEKTIRAKTRDLTNRLDALSKELGFATNIREYSKLFVALSLSNLSPDGQMSIITPSTWLGDKESYDLRRLIIDNAYLNQVILFREDSGLFETVNQHTAVCVFSKHSKDAFEVVSGYDLDSQLGEPNKIYYQDIKSSDPKLLKIPRHDSKNDDIISILRQNPTIGSVVDLKNLRGEIDLSLNKQLVSNKDTGHRLIRGDHVERYILHPSSKSKKDSFVNLNELNGNLGSNPKFKDSLNFRIVGRQCSYLDKKRRLDFTIAEPGAFVGNSCNYLYFKSDNNLKKPSQKMLALLGMLNSSVLEWFFRLYNSNNHVANYEISSFPICLNSDFLQLIAKSTSFLLAIYKNELPNESISSIEDFHDALVGIAYGLTPGMIGSILESVDPKRKERVINFAEHISEGILPLDIIKSSNWFNHYVSTLSSLDEEIIRHVPQGGNWQNIPEHVPSQRLQQIRKMSEERGVVRTTYYGRLRPEQPSYTIATYYNRPGNGTNIHPWEDRTISSREAARLQSFPDNYIFHGSEGGIRTQIGNAVPPLLAYSLGKHLGNRYGLGNCVDAFAGAGGLSCGLELAGWNVIAANDNDKYAAITYRANRPTEKTASESKNKTFFLEGSIIDKNIQEEFISGIERKLGGQELDLLVGGPPCQGFSHAGFRRQDDARNDLASIYLKLATKLKPKTFVLENVEGLLTYNKGQVVRDIIKSLTEIGYKVEAPWVVNAEQFGTPQMRRRVLIVANKEEIVPGMQHLFRKCAGRRIGKVVEQPHLSLPVTTGEALVDLPPLRKRRFLKGLNEINRLYSQWLKGLINTEDFLSTRSKIRGWL